MNEFSRIHELAYEIMEKTMIVNDYLIATRRPQPSFDLYGPVDVALESTEAEQARIACIGASMELQDLMQGPIACLRPAVKEPHDESRTNWLFVHELIKVYDRTRSTPPASKPSTVMTFPAKSRSTTEASPSKNSL